MSYQQLRCNLFALIRLVYIIVGLPHKGRYTYGVHENCLIFKTPPTPLVHMRPKFFHPLDLGRPISNTPPRLLPLQMITSKLKENIIQG